MKFWHKVKHSFERAHTWVFGHRHVRKSFNVVNSDGTVVKYQHKKMRMALRRLGVK